MNGCKDSFCTISGNALVIDTGCVYVGGAFIHAGLVTANNLAQWCSGSWSAIKPKLETIEGTDGPVYTLVSDGAGGLYIGGFFLSPRTNLVSTDFYNWNGAGEALNNTVRAIALQGNDVFAAGDFTNASGSGANHIARLINGAPKWTVLGNSLNDGVISLAWQGSTLVAGGLFTQSGALGVNHVARWDGVNWLALGAGVDGPAWAVATDPNFIYTGGAFFNAGGKPAAYFDRWGQYKTFEPVISR